MSGDPLVYVIIPTFNRLALLKESVASVLAQTMTNFELIVIDDGSTDGTVPWLDAQEDERLKFAVIPHSGLPAVARNHGIEISRGGYVAFLDDDDLWLPNKLNVQVNVARMYPNAGLYYSLAMNFDEQGDRGDIGGYGTVEDLLFDNFIPCPTVMVRKSVLTSVGGFDERSSYRAIEDYELWLRIAYSQGIHFTPRVLAKHRINPGGIFGDPMGMYDRWELVLRNVFVQVTVPQRVQRRALWSIRAKRMKLLLKRFLLTPLHVWWIILIPVALIIAFWSSTRDQEPNGPFNRQTEVEGHR